MENRKAKFWHSRPGDIARKWICVGVPAYFVVGFGLSGLGKLFADTGGYVEYYKYLIFALLTVPGIMLFFMGLIFHELTYYFNCKRYKNIIILIIILCCICGTSFKLIPYSDSYRFYKDFHYVINNTYLEDITELNNIYKEVTTGKAANTRIYIETTDLKFEIDDNIVKESDYDSFKARFNNVKKVKIKYLPNSEILLSIEPVKDEK